MHKNLPKNAEAAPAPHTHTHASGWRSVCTRVG